jgi:hypothetical protein
MTKTICGHEREALRSRLIASQLRDKGLDIDGALECHLNILIDGVSDPSTLKHHVANCAAIDVDIYDPVKLAEMLAEEGRRWGVAVETLRHISLAEGGHGLRFRVYARLVRKTMPQTRALLLKWLQLPNGAREEAERTLRGEL